MADIDKVTKGLECHKNGLCQIDDKTSCPYWECEKDCSKHLMGDALELLKGTTGRWIYLENCSNSGVYCSECKVKVSDKYPMKKKLSYFCPHCGTRMEGKVVRM